MSVNPGTRRRSPQAPRAVVMVRPKHFQPNPQTAADNKFQRSVTDTSFEEVSAMAFAEVSAAATALESAGVTVHLFDDCGQNDTPDSVFPNNWFSTHAGGHVAVYPMYSPNRRRERRVDVIEMLKALYRVQDIVDYSGLEHDDIFLEGTGAMVLDHIERVAYAACSNRAAPAALERFCTHFNFEPMAFESSDSSGTSIYHTNVLMCIGTEFVLLGTCLIKDEQRRAHIEERLRLSGRTLIKLSERQINEFAGNAIELEGRAGPLLALSERAMAALLPVQIQVIERSATLLPLSVPTIELAGGSVRCMLAGVHLTKR